MQDTFEGLEEDDVEDLADEEVEKVLFEITQGLSILDTPPGVEYVLYCALSISRRGIHISFFPWLTFSQWLTSPIVDLIVQSLLQVN